MNKAEIIKGVNDVMIAREPIDSISLFGSFLHGTADSSSDLDLLFVPARPLSLFESGGIQQELEKKFGIKVDFVPSNSLIPQLREQILNEAEIIYERK